MSDSSSELSSSEERRRKEAKRERKAKRRAERAAREAEEREKEEKKEKKEKNKDENDKEGKKDKKDKKDKKKKQDESEEEVETPRDAERKKKKEEKKRKRDEDENKEEEEEEKPKAKKQKSDEKAESQNGNGSNPFLSNDSKFISEWRAAQQMNVDGPVTNFKPFETFVEGKFPNDLLAITKKWTKPTPIQAQSWPIILSKHDLVGIAETGSGKTLAFGLPGLMHVQASKNKKLPAMLVIAPTRELAIQTHDVLIEASKSAGIKVICLYGGVDKFPQREALRKGVGIVVCTPGRLLDLVNEGVCDLSNVEYLVLDEADRMLDMGFENDIRAIIRQLPKHRQTVMFSATWPQSIQGLAMEFLKKPVKITIGSEELLANKNVKQIVEVIQDRARDERLIQLLKDYHSSRTNKVIIFVLYKKEAVRVQEFLKRRGYNAAGIHGDLSQAQRMEALKSFMDNSSPLLIATDVAARGLDIPKVEYVINYSFPLTIEDYVHRIGRTGRAGAKGISHTFFQDVDKHHAGGLVTLFKEAGQPLPMDHSIMQFPLYTKKKDAKPAEFKLGPIDIHAKSDGHVEFSDSD